MVHRRYGMCKMKYKNIKKGRFISRPNRFIAIVKINNKEEICHVKNTGRCKELLVPGVEVILEKSDNAKRKTKYDVVAVYKGDKLINIDSQAPNKVFYEYLKEEKLFKNIKTIKPEAKYKNSRFDFFVEADGKEIFIETKGVTLEENDVFMFPDAPTERGVKHINELCECVKEDYEAYIVFIIQAEYGKYFVPNSKTHKEFADTLKKAVEAGVNVLCYNCEVKEDFLAVREKMEYRV